MIRKLFWRNSNKTTNWLSTRKTTTPNFSPGQDDKSTRTKKNWWPKSMKTLKLNQIMLIHLFDFKQNPLKLLSTDWNFCLNCVGQISFAVYYHKMWCLKWVDILVLFEVWLFHHCGNKVLCAKLYLIKLMHEVLIKCVKRGVSCMSR